MLANVSRDILLFLLILIFVIAIAVIVGGTIWGILVTRKNNSSNKKKMIIISIILILIAAVSWILNIGWIRFIMTLLLIPIIHAIIFFVTNLFVSNYTDKLKNIKILNLLFCLTYILFYVFLPDGADYGEMYFFFGLIHSNALANIAQRISSMAFLVHIILFILQIVKIVKIKKNQSDNACI